MKERTLKDMDIRTSVTGPTQALKPYLEELHGCSDISVGESLKGPRRSSVESDKLKSTVLPSVQINELLEVNLL